MKRVILTTSDTGGGSLKASGLADMVIPFGLDLVCGPPPSDAVLTELLSGGPKRRTVSLPRWADVVGRREREVIAAKGLGLLDFCMQSEMVELWVDPVPNAQLMLVWLLSRFRGHEAASRLALVQSNVQIGGKHSEEIAGWVPPAVAVSDEHLEIASLAWQAYRAPTPQPWFDLLAKDLSALPQLRRAVLALLEELPSRMSGLGATELRLLELISEWREHPSSIERGGVRPFDLFPNRNTRNERLVFDYWATGELLDGLAICPAPAVSGLDEGPFTFEMQGDRQRRQRYEESRLSLTPLGEAIVAGREDFSRHNPIHRWWGGTELSNDRLWRWDPAKGALIAP